MLVSDDRALEYDIKINPFGDSGLSCFSYETLWFVSEP